MKFSFLKIKNIRCYKLCRNLHLQNNEDHIYMILYKIKPGIFERTVPVFSNLPINLANVLSGPQQCCDKDEVDFTNAIANNYLYLFPLEFHQNNNLW